MRVLFLVCMVFVLFSSGCGLLPSHKTRDDFHWDGAQDCIDAWLALKASIDEFNDEDNWEGAGPPTFPHPCEDWYLQGVRCTFTPPTNLDTLPSGAGHIYGDLACICMTTQTTCALGLDEVILQFCDDICPAMIAWFEKGKKAVKDAKKLTSGQIVSII